MAKVASAFPAADGKYGKYFDGQLWCLKLGKDCPADMNIAQNSIRVTASRKGIKATVRQCKAEGCIYVQAIGKLPAKKRKPR